MSLERLVTAHPTLLVRQAREWVEILLGVEEANRYEICDEAGRVVARAAESGGGLLTLLLRMALRRLRPLDLKIYNAAGEPLGTAKKPFRFYFHEFDIFDKDQKIGKVIRRFAIFSRRFELLNAEGQVLATLESRLFRIWTFKVLVGGREIGRISKRWGGLLREAFTDADTFGVAFGEAEPRLRKLLLFATFLVDFTSFEDNSNQRGLLPRARRRMGR